MIRLKDLLEGTPEYLQIYPPKDSDTEKSGLDVMKKDMRNEDWENPRKNFTVRFLSKDPKAIKAEIIDGYDRKIGRIVGHMENKTDFRIGMIQVDTGLPGLTGMRRIFREIQRQLPDVKRLTGRRLSGIRRGPAGRGSADVTFNLSESANNNITAYRDAMLKFVPKQLDQFRFLGKNEKGIWEIAHPQYPEITISATPFLQGSSTIHVTVERNEDILDEFNIKFAPLVKKVKGKKQFDPAQDAERYAAIMREELGKKVHPTEFEV